MLNTVINAVLVGIASRDTASRIIGEVYSLGAQISTSSLLGRVQQDYVLRLVVCEEFWT